MPNICDALGKYARDDNRISNQKKIQSISLEKNFPNHMQAFALKLLLQIWRSMSLKSKINLFFYYFQ